MTTGEIIKNRRKELGYSAEYIADKIGVSVATLYRYESGDITKVPSSALQKMADVLGVFWGYFFGHGSEEDYNKAQEKISSHSQKILTQLPLYDIPVSAGTGQWLADGCEYEYVEFENVPNGVDFALKVRGDSMEPMYSDCDVVFIKANIIVESGQIGVFCLNDEGYLKQLQGNRLVSLNPAYKPIIIGEYDSFFCVGRVIGKVK